MFQPVFDIDRVKTLQNRFCRKCDDDVEEKREVLPSYITVWYQAEFEHLL